MFYKTANLMKPECNLTMSEINEINPWMKKGWEIFKSDWSST